MALRRNRRPICLLPKLQKAISGCGAYPKPDSRTAHRPSSECSAGRSFNLQGFVGLHGRRMAASCNMWKGEWFYALFRFLNYANLHSETRSWDVRTKRVTYDVIPTIEGVIGIANHGPTATLFTLGRNYTAQQYDINPNAAPIQVQSVQHVPANTPPTPPTTLEEQNKSHGQQEVAADARRLANLTDVESSADEGGTMSPLQKIAREMETLDQLESEIRDKVMPLSPVSSRASSVSSTKSSQGAQRQQKYLYDQPSSSRASTNTGYGYDGTEF